MTHQTRSDLQQLSESVSQLCEALAASERRRMATARAVRWGALAFIVLVAAVLYAASDQLKAFAAQISWDSYEQQMAQQPPALDQILMSLMNSEQLQGALVKVLQSTSMIAASESADYVACEAERAALPPEEQKAKLCFTRTPVEDLGEFYLNGDGTMPQAPGPGASQQEQMAYAQKLMASTIMAVGQVAVDGAVLVHRIRRDSDRFRETVNKIGGVRETLNAIRDELHMMNGALLSVPAMANEMNVMNRQMSVMSYGVGSTMGRMGNIIPW
jgi:hypothetical protein